MYRFVDFTGTLLSGCVLFVISLFLTGCSLLELSTDASLAATATSPATTAAPTEAIPTATATRVVQRTALPTTIPMATPTAVTQATVIAGRSVSEKYIGDFVDSSVALLTFRATDDRRHYAYLAQSIFGWFVMWDGNVGKTYNEIDPNTLRLSDDGSHLGYVARSGEKWLVVIDDQEAYSAERHLVFGMSRDGRHVAHSAGRSAYAEMVIDGKPGTHYSLVSTPFFSPDSQHVAYISLLETAPGKYSYRMVRDGQAGTAYDGIDLSTIVFSPDSQHLAFIATLGEGDTQKQFVVLDGVEKKSYESVEPRSVYFSPDSRRIAYAAKRNGQWLVVTDDKESTPWEKACTCISFSPDSKRLAYQGATRSAWYAVIDGKPSQAYQAILTLTPIFSPDSQRTAYMALSQTGWLVIVDNKELTQDRYEFPLYGGLVFSPDNRRLAYAARRAGQWSVYVDGQQGQIYTNVLAGPVFAAPDRMSYITLRDNQILFVEEKLPALLSTPPATATPQPHPGVPIPDYFKSAKPFDMKGIGPLSLAGGDFPLFHYRPTDNPKNIDVVKSLTLQVTTVKTSGNPGPTLDFQFYDLEGGGWGINGGKNRINWGVNNIDIQFPDQYVSRKGDIYLAIRNFGTETVELKSINFTLVVRNEDGTQVTYQPVK